MLGFKPVGADAAGAVEGALVEVDRQLGPYQEAWDSLVDAWLTIRIDDPQVGLRWLWLVFGVEGGGVGRAWGPG